MYETLEDLRPTQPQQHPSHSLPSASLNPVIAQLSQQLSEGQSHKKPKYKIVMLKVSVELLELESLFLFAYFCA